MLKLLAALASCAKSANILKLFLVLAALAKILLAAPRQYEIKCQQDRANTATARVPLNVPHDVPQGLASHVPALDEFHLKSDYCQHTRKSAGYARKADTPALSVRPRPHRGHARWWPQITPQAAGRVGGICYIDKLIS